MTRVDLLIHSAAQLVTCASPNGPKRGTALADVGEIANGAVAVAEGRIVAVGPSDDVRGEYKGVQEIDASGHVVCPGFVDAHTHLVFAGDRTREFEAKLAGASYMDILAAGGGILSTMRATRVASLAELTAQSSLLLHEMSQLGTTTVEIKSGYGLDTASEIKILEVIDALAAKLCCEVIPTFLGAHAVPPPFQNRSDDYVQLVIEEMLPAAVEWHSRSSLAAQPFFCDVFCEPGAFDYAQTAAILQAAQQFAMPLKLHADEFVTQGGVPLAVSLGATSVDHLDVTPPPDVAQLAASPTVAVVLPAVNFHLGSTHYADARGLIAAGAALALATDANPGSAPCLSLPLVMAVACRYQKLSPAEALNAVTINAAHALGLGSRLGSLEAGKQADLLLIDAPDYRHLAYWFGHNLVRRVFKRSVEVAVQPQVTPYYALPKQAAPAGQSRYIQQGDIYWAAPFAGGEDEAAIPHPYVIVQENVLNDSRIDTVVACALTSNLWRTSETPGNVLLEAGEANLPKQSVVEVSKVSTIAKAQLGEYIGSLTTQRVDQVLAGMRFFQTTFFNRSTAGSEKANRE